MSNFRRCTMNGVSLSLAEAMIWRNALRRGWLAVVRRVLNGGSPRAPNLVVPDYFHSVVTHPEIVWILTESENGFGSRI
jgi:hypothetical protein